MQLVKRKLKKIEILRRFSALAKLYQNIGFHRKSAFFLRVSAMRCVAPQNQHPDWNLCYQVPNLHYF